MRDTEGLVSRSVGKRRRFSEEYQREVVQETLAPGASVAGVALKHRLNANLVFIHLAAQGAAEAGAAAIGKATTGDRG